MESFKEINPTTPKTREDQGTIEVRTPLCGKDSEPHRISWDTLVSVKNDHVSTRSWGHQRQASHLTVNLNRNADAGRGLGDYLVWPSSYGDKETTKNERDISAESNLSAEGPKRERKKNNNERDTERKKKNIFCFVLFFLTAEVCTF